MEMIIDELASRGYEVSGSDTLLTVKLGTLTNRVVIRKSLYTNSIEVSAGEGWQLFSYSLLIAMLVLEITRYFLDPNKILGSLSIAYLVCGIPAVLAGYIGIIITEIRMIPIREVVRKANLSYLGSR
ncbi:hypothetical protein L4D20_13705 [Vibrio kyushuensis]|uniref:hypothetical protein n=1 Tax=Vibrio kyushuensis TaxID=2910249 RepID=UPI003D12F14A